MKHYTIKPDYLSSWGEDCTEETVIDTAEVERLSEEWEKPVYELLEQLEEAYWYAVMTGPDDTDWGTGSYVLSEAKDKVISYRESGYPDAYIAVISDDDDPICVREIHEF